MRSVKALARRVLVILGGALAVAESAACDSLGTTEQNQDEVVAVLEVHALDLWGQALPKEGLSLTIDGKTVGAQVQGGVLRIPLTPNAASIDLRLSAPDHGTLETTVMFDGTPALGGAVVTSATEGHGAAMSHELDEDERPVHRLYLGLRHAWFSAEGRPARRGNRVDFLMDGEQAWKSVHQDLVAADREVMVSTWWWESDFELVRPEGTHASLSDAERRKNTILGVLEAIPAHKRVLVGQLLGQDGAWSSLTVDGPLKAHGAATDDHFEFMGQANLTRGKFTFQMPDFLFSTRLDQYEIAADTERFDPDQPIRSTIPEKAVDLKQWPVKLDLEHASFHQKFMVIDDDVSYVGGMNLRKVDWDTGEHRVFDSRRMKFGASEWARKAVETKEALPDMGPRKDYMVRVEGPSSQDVADVFQRRWSQAIADGVANATQSTPFEVEREIEPRSGGVQLQVTTTLPEPYWEHGIMESWLNAIAQAEDYVYIEDQYFRAPLLNDALLARMKAKPALKLVVITKPVSEWSDPGCRWTYESAALFAKSFPERFLFLQLRAFDTHAYVAMESEQNVPAGAQKAEFVDMDLHAKLLVVDDKFMSVGSCNKNNRGMIYEGEMNVAILDAAWVGAARRRVVTNLLPQGTAVPDSADAWFVALQTAAKANDQVHARWRGAAMRADSLAEAASATRQPSGFLYSLGFDDVSDCLFESVGPDMTGAPTAGDGNPSDPGGPE